jgi:hypothetical protein
MTPRTVVIPGDGTNVLSFTIPSNVDFNVESVVASVDAAAAGDTIGELAIAEVTGEVIATKRQGLPIPGGGSGTETWALRLNDEEAAAAAGTGYPFAASGVNGFYNVPSGVSTQFGIDVGSLITSDSAIFFEQAHVTPGLTGLGIGATGTYAAFWTVQYEDTAGAPVANPETFTAEADDGSGSLVTILPFLFSIFGRGVTNLNGRSEWDCGWCSVFAIHGGTAAGDPIVLSGNQATGVTLRAFDQLLVFQLSTSTFGF